MNLAQTSTTHRKAKVAWPRFSLALLLALTAFIAVGSAALAYASLWWATICLSSSLVILALGLLGILYRRAAHRAFWVGFALLGFGYLILLYAPGFDRLVGWRLVTTKIIAVVQPHLQQTNSDMDSYASQLVLAKHPQPLTVFTETGVRWEDPLPQWYFFQQVGHAIFSLIFAWLGGLVSRYFYTMTKNETDSDADASAT